MPPASPVSNNTRIHRCITRCLSGAAATLHNARNVRNGSEREVWKCIVSVNGVQAATGLTLFKPGTLESGNASLPPALTAQKCALAMAELPQLGIATPDVLGYAVEDAEAALLTE